MPIDVEGLKRKYGQDSKPEKDKFKDFIIKPKDEKHNKPEKDKIKDSIIKPKEEKDIIIELETINTLESKNKMLKEIKKKRREKNMTKAKSNTKPKGKSDSGLERPFKTKERYDAMFEDDEIQQINPNESIGVNQPINNNNDLIKLMNTIVPIGQDNGNNNNTLGELQRMKLMKDLFFNTQPQGKNSESNMIKFMGMMQQQSSENLRLIMENSNIKFNQLAQMFGGKQEDPMSKFMEGVKFTREQLGDNRAKTKDEMDFGLRSKELDLKDYARRDLLDREERNMDRENAKGQRFMEIGGVVLDKVIGQGLGTLVGDLMSSIKNGKGSKTKASNNAKENFDHSLLDEL